MEFLRHSLPSQQYRHRPLQGSQSIRVLELYPGEPDDILQGRLLEVSLDHSLRYEALSYAWGSSEQVDEINFDSQTLGITQSCSIALRNLREPKKYRLLWIDSICIDQESAFERNHQVRLMGRVYWNANRVIVWLGLGNQQTHRAMKYLKNIAQQRDSSLISRPEKLNALFKQTWFDRAWTVQEIALSRTGLVVCGHDSIS
ncbi:heterokaryon incompatibility protein-domain-containing protein, partial [Clohesyomyces aquaticus]